MHSLIKHSLIKIGIIENTKVSKESTWKYRMVDSIRNKSILQNINEYKIVF